jgi:hypothetical protein
MAQKFSFEFGQMQEPGVSESVREVLTQICSGLTNNRWVLRSQNRGYEVEASIVRFFLEITMICGRHFRVLVDAKKSRNVRKAEIAYAIQASANRRAFAAQSLRF